MKEIMGFIKATVAGGVVFLVPIVVLAVVLKKAFLFSQKLVKPFDSYLPLAAEGRAGVVVILSIAVLVVFCFAAGLLARTYLARRAVGILEYRLLEKLPGYSFTKRMGESLAGFEREEGLRVVLARIEEAWEIGFLMEELGDGYSAVYIPGVPRPWTGSLFFVSQDRLRHTDISPRAAMKCLRELGVGSKDYVKGLP